MHRGVKNLLIIGPSQGNYGGIEAFMIAIAEAGLEWPGFNIKLCFKLVKGAKAGNNLKLSARKNGLKVCYIKRGSLELAKLVIWADVLHVQNTPPDIIFLGRLFRKKMFLTIHNKRVRAFNLHSILWNISMKLAYQRWYNSEFVWQTWEPRKKLANSECVPTVCKFPENWCPPSHRKGFLFVGRWIENKGIEELLEAYAINKFDPGEQPLTILGDGPLKKKIFEIIKKLDLKVSTPGFVDDNSKADYISSARWIVAPANTSEDLGLTPIEGRSVGVPSIVSRDGGLPEAGGVAALIVEPGNIADLARSMKIAAQMDMTEYVRRTEVAYNSLTTFLKPISFYRDAFNK